MNEVRAVLFDLDGTLLDTLDDLAVSCNWALAQLRRPARTRDEVRGFVGNGVRTLCERLLAPDADEASVQAAMRHFAAHYDAHMADATRPYAGILALLEELKRRRVARAVVSNKYDAATKAICQRYFGDLIDYAVGEGNGVAKKPCPEGALRAMRALGVLPAQALYVGDSDVDVETAHNAGLPCISVTWGFRPRDLLLRAGADAIIDEPAQLLAVMERLSRG